MRSVIPVGPWLFDPATMTARNTHNGNIAYIDPTNSGWRITCVNCPAQWMLEHLAKWLQSWLSGLPMPKEN